MNLHTFAAVVLAALLVSAGAAVAAPGNAPVDAGSNASDEARGADAGNAGGTGNGADRGENASANGEDHRQNASANGAAAGERGGNASISDAADVSAADARGPPVSMPDEVPEHVSAIHDTIREFLAGGLDGSLGEAIRGLTADERAASAGG